MTLRLPNITFGFTVLFISAVLGGMTLGATFNENSIKDGYHMLTEARFFLRDGHSHGNFMCFFNLFVGIILNNLALSEKLKTICSYAAMAAIFLPIGLALKGAGLDTPIGLIGVLGAATALIILIIGSFKSLKSS